MKKNHVQTVIIHMEDCPDPSRLWESVSTFYAGYIGRKLSQSDLTSEQQIAVIDKVIKNLKLREINNQIP